MTDIVWPEELPNYVLQDGYSRAFADGRNYEQPDAGPPMTRLLYSSAVVPQSLKIIVDEAGVSAFEAFWLEHLKRGVKSFWLRHHIRDGQPLLDENGAVITDENDEPYLMSEYDEVMVGDQAPVTTPAGGLYYHVTFPVVVLP